MRFDKSCDVECRGFFWGSLSLSLFFSRFGSLAIDIKFLMQAK
ncbi:hypothetical protein H206_06961 [Candidatus Electrothrix aarhusensis]|uniref:Uncharacterized protein n=1 Tax=Candidatus Electrothrix aarhusensis TaxID=1859131 RepID=A0A3S3R9Y6_9BACT|nr:hypothetical protein H206_06961 [Candidatus Electrothrix aarhusensis]